MQAVPFETWVKPILDQIRANTGKSWHAHSFREGTGLVCDGVSAVSVPQFVAIDSSTQLAKVALEALKPRAQVIIKGTK